MNKDLLISVIDDLQAGRTPTLPIEAFPGFAKAGEAGNDHASPETLLSIAGQLTSADIPTFERACDAMDAGELAWLGFKVVYDKEQAVVNEDIGVMKKYGDVGSADGESLVFFCNDAKEIVASRQPSARDIFQMKDVTRGPSMHCDQFPGLTWLSEPLFGSVHVWLVGASDVASEVSSLATHVGFSVSVIDNDTAYINEERFPDATRVVLSGEDFAEIEDVVAAPEDYVCVLTRGHVFDPEGCLWAVRNGVHYVGMMGCAGKNGAVYERLTEQGITNAQWDSVKRPIGLKFGAKTPAELAIAIVAELVDVRYKQRYSQEEQDRHDKSLGR